IRSERPANGQASSGLIHTAKSAIRTRRQTGSVSNMGGHIATLVPAHPGNTNAVRYGVHSARFLAERAAQIAGDLSMDWEFEPVELVVVREIAQISALIDAIDRDLDERGLVRRGGKPSYL